MIDFTSDNLYELELFVPDPSLCWVPDPSGDDTIVAQESHSEIVTIDLGYMTDGNGTSVAAMASYFGGQFEIWHQLVVYGVVENATGSPGSDLIRGNELNNRLLGAVDLVRSGGADTIYGEAGNDTIMGGAGNDLLFGGADQDFLVGNSGSDRMFGDAGRDILSGGVGADRLDGGDDRDRLIGGPGGDILTGGAGADVFVYQARGDSQDLPGRLDRITDFDAGGGDRISLAALDADLTKAGDQAFLWVGGGFSGQAGELTVEVRSNGMMVLADVDGDAVADFSVLLLGLTTAPEDWAFLL